MPVDGRKLEMYESSKVLRGGFESIVEQTHSNNELNASGASTLSSTIHFADKLQRDADAFVSDVKDWIADLVGKGASSEIVVTSEFTLDTKGMFDLHTPCGDLTASKTFAVVKTFLDNPTHATLDDKMAESIMWHPSKACVSRKNSMEVDGGSHAEFAATYNGDVLLNVTSVSSGVTKTVNFRTVETTGAFVGVDYLDGSVRAVGATGRLILNLKLRLIPDKVDRILKYWNAKVRECAAANELSIVGVVGGGWRQKYSKYGGLTGAYDTAVLGYAEAFEIHFGALEIPAVPPSTSVPTPEPVETPAPSTTTPEPLHTPVQITQIPELIDTPAPTAKTLEPVSTPAPSSRSPSSADNPSAEPDREPTKEPDENPVTASTREPTTASVDTPAEEPSETSTSTPTEAPVNVSTEKSNEQPTETPYELPLGAPTESPSKAPVEKSTEPPSEQSTDMPSEQPTETPVDLPSAKMTETPTEVPLETPTESLSEEPIQGPARVPTEKPNSNEQTNEPISTEQPAEEPSETPSEGSTGTPSTEMPTTPTPTDSASQLSFEPTRAGPDPSVSSQVAADDPDAIQTISLTLGNPNVARSKALKALSDRMASQYLQSGVECAEMSFDDGCFMNATMGKVLYGSFSSAALDMGAGTEALPETPPTYRSLISVFMLLFLGAVLVALVAKRTENRRRRRREYAAIPGEIEAIDASTI